MHILLLFGIAATATALSASGTGGPSVCSDVQIPVTVSEKRFILNTTVENDWDAVSFIFNLTSRSLATPFDPLPIAGQTDSAVESNYSIGATLCGTGGTMLILTHGIIESKLQVTQQQTLGKYEAFGRAWTNRTTGISNRISHSRNGIASWTQPWQQGTRC